MCESREKGKRIQFLKEKKIEEIPNLSYFMDYELFEDPNKAENPEEKERYFISQGNKQ
jgi:hypothetical protein